jgi:lysophospholipase L1-like esterase
VVISPIYRCDVEKADSMKVVKEIMAKYDVPFWDYSRNRMFSENPELFADRDHLNNRGAELFSKIVAHRIITKFIKSVKIPRNSMF